jgi:hypothetical protein
MGESRGAAAVAAREYLWRGLPLGDLALSFDYMLYDNRTYAGAVVDWRLKMATGRLQDDGGAQKRFVEYCEDSFETRRSSPPEHDEWWALGGIRLGERYVVCVTLPTRDRTTRPSLAIVGLYCPEHQEVRRLLETCDPRATAAAVYDCDTPPPVLEPRGPAIIPSSRTLGPFVGFPSQPKAAAFRPGDSPREAAAFLWEAAAREMKLPSILGIVVGQSPASLNPQLYQLAFYERRPPAVEQPVSADRNAAPVAGEPEPRRAVNDVRPSPHIRRWLQAVIVVVLGIGIGSGTVLLLRSAPVGESRDAGAQHVEAAAPEKPIAASPSASTFVAADADALVTRVETLVTELMALDARQLQSTEEYRILREVKVLPEHEVSRRAMLELLESELAAVQTHVRQENLPFYFEPRQKQQLSLKTRIEELRARLQRTTLPDESCQLLRTSFRSFLAAPGSVSSKWCRIAEGLAAAASGKAMVE